MGLRSLEQLKRDQAAILDAHLRRNEGLARNLARPTVPSGRLQWGQVVELVTSDDDFGPHLVVQGLVYSGSPPTLTTATAESLRCYPAPGRSISHYAADDFVQLCPSEAAMIALPIG